MKEFIFLDGKAINPHDLPPLRSLFFGEGVFETFRWKSDLPVFWTRHVERMRRGAEVLEIPAPAESDIRRAVESAVSESGIDDAAVKICLLSHGKSAFYEKPEASSILLSVKPYTPRPPIVRVSTSSIRRNSTSPAVRIKSLNYLENALARREAIARGFDEAIFLNENGEIAEGSASNIFWRRGGKLYTPSPECGLLSGVMRQAVIEVADKMGVERCEGRFKIEALNSSEWAFITNSLIGVAAVSEIEGIRLGDNVREFELVKEALLRRLNWL